MGGDMAYWGIRRGLWVAFVFFQISGDVKRSREMENSISRGLVVI